MKQITSENSTRPKSKKGSREEEEKKQHWKNTSKSSCFLLNSASVLEESHSRLYSWAISFNCFSFASPVGVLTESFSIICKKAEIIKMDQVRMPFLQTNQEAKNSRNAWAVNCTVDACIRTQLRGSQYELLPIFCSKQVLDLQ